MKATLIDCVSVGNTLGEGVLWDSVRKRVWWTDIQECRLHLGDIAICNSLCFSPDGPHMYFADSPRREILKFDLEADTGALSNRRIFVRTPRGAYPDGSAVDSDGHLWNAQWGAGCVMRYAPDGTISGRIDLPVTQPTCVAFGGKEFDLLMVTSARDTLDAATLGAEPQAGNLFIFKTNVSGCGESHYRVA